MGTTLATWGLFVAWAVHDAEEWFTMPGWGGRNADRLRRMYPRIPARLLRLLDFPAPQVRLAITLMAVVVALAAADGARTGGRSLFFQVALIGFGVHAVFHVGQSALARGYTPGVVTAVLVVAPFSLWAWYDVDAAGAVGDDVTGVALVGILLVAPLVILVHGAALLLLRWVR
jgi:hypothetical protein